MQLTTKSIVRIHGRETRVLSHHFNRSVKLGYPVLTLEGEVISPSKGMKWCDTCKALRMGKSVQAKVGGLPIARVQAIRVDSARRVRNIRKGESFRRTSHLTVPLT